MNSSRADSLIFGPIISGVAYTSRPAAYALIFNNDRRLAVSKARRGYFLPGGGVESRELPEEAVIREVKEETSRDARILHKIGEAIEYFSIDNRYYRLEAEFFLAEFTSESQGEGEHPLLWLALHEPLVFFYQCHNWIVKQACRNEC